MRDGGRWRCEGHAMLAWRRYGEVQIARWVFALRLAREPNPEDEREGRDVGPSPPLTGDPLLEVVIYATVAPHEPRDRRVPATVTPRMPCRDQSAARPNAAPLKEM
jgi:hypothetical protein